MKEELFNYLKQQKGFENIEYTSNYAELVKENKKLKEIIEKAINDLKEKGYKEFSKSRFINNADILYQKRFRDEKTGVTQYFINAWVFKHDNEDFNIEFELATETINSYWSKYLIYSVPDFITIEDIERGMYQHWLVDGALYGD